jgi:hypothetical protein
MSRIPRRGATRRTRAVPFDLALLLAGSALACGAGDLLRLVAVVTREFGPASINITNSHLTVTLQNARADSAGSDPVATARRVAELVRDRYPGYAKLEDVTVVFQSRSQYGPVGMSRGNGAYSFTREELGPPRTSR